MPNETDQFFSDLENDQNTKIDLFEEPLVPEAEKPKEESHEYQGDDEHDYSGIKPRNRRERRLMEKLQQERESAMFLAGKLEARTEAERAVSEESDYLKAIERIYGTDTPEAQLATDLLKKAIIGARDDAEIRAYERVQQERMRDQEAFEEADSMLDSIVEEIEDTYDVELNAAQQRSYFQLLQKMSPKDEDGEVVSLADPHAVWEIFQERLQKRGTDNRAKALSSRSMVQSGASKESTIQDDVTLRTLRDHGIL